MEQIRRRDILRLSAALGVSGLGTTVAGSPPVGHREAASDAGSIGAAQDASAKTWMTDEVPNRPLHDVCLPGTHHAPMNDCGANFWFHTQRRNMQTQLEDGIRYLDVRPGVYYSQETLVDSGVAQAMAAEWTALVDEAGGLAALLPDIEGIDPSVVQLLESLLDLEDPAWVANAYTNSCADTAADPADAQLSLESFLVRTLVSLFARPDFDMPTFDLDLSTMRLDQPANFDVAMDDFRAHHGGQRTNPYDWGVSLADGFAGVRQYLDDVAESGASEILVLHNRYFWDFLDVDLSPSAWAAYRQLYEDSFGEYLLDLSAHDPASFAGLAPADLDGPRVAVLWEGPGLDETERPAWAGGGEYLTKHFGGSTEPGNSLSFAVSHTESTPHADEALDWVEYQVTPGNDAVIGVTVDVVNPFSEYDSRLLYANLLQAARRTNATLSGYVAAIKRDPDQQPNLLSLDFYDTSQVVTACRGLSREGYISGDALLEEPVLTEDRYRLRRPGGNEAVTVRDGDAAGTCGLEPWSADSAQQFDLVANGDQTYRVASAAGEGVLTVADGGTANGDDVTLEAWDGRDSQRWFVVALDGGPEYLLVNRHSGLALDGASDYPETTDGDLVQWHLHLGANQRWLLETEPDEPPPVAGRVTPSDPDGDWLYEDVRGDGSLDVFDVQALFDNLDAEAVQDHPVAFDFDGSAGEVTVADVQALFERLE